VAFAGWVVRKESQTNREDTVGERKQKGDMEGMRWVREKTIEWD